MSFSENVLLKPLLERSRVGVISDFDGTLSPIVKIPEAAVMTERCRAALTALQPELTVLGFVSGRGVLDLMERAQLDGAEFIGNHGLERWTPDGVVSPAEIQQYRPALEYSVRIIDALQLPGVRVEDKGATLSIHYRNAENQTAVAAQLQPLMQQLAAQYGLATFGGRMVFELRPPVAINKGTAFETLVNDYQLEAAVFLGDDVTDTDAMKMARQMRTAGYCHAVAIGVVSSSTAPVVLENSDVTVEGVEGVEAFLEWLAAARSVKSQLASSS